MQFSVDVGAYDVESGINGATFPDFKTVAYVSIDKMLADDCI